jgi:O-antigen/teichoic acid export membrane protein
MSDEIIVMNNPRKSLIYNAFASSLGWFLPIILTFVATPIVVKGLGYEQYGIYALILGFVGYSFTFGVGRAVTKYVAEYRSSGKNEQISEIISASFWFSIILSLAGSLVIVIFSEPIVADVLQINAELHDLAIKSLYIACSTIGFLMIGQVFQAVLQGIHRFDRVSLLITLGGFLLNFGNILLVFTGFGFVSLLFWNLFLTAVNSLIYYVLAKKYLPDLAINFKLKRETVRLVLSYGSGVIGYQIFANALLIFERSWITRNLGAESLTFYVVPMTVALYMHAFISSVVTVIFPVISELQNQPEKLLLLYQRATKIIFSIVVFIVLTIICSSKMFLTLWINPEFAEKSAPILITLTLSFSVISILCIVWQLAEGFGHPRFNAIISFLWFAVSVPLMIWLIFPLGNFGSSIGRLIGHLITLPFIFIGEKKFLGEVQWKFWGRLISVIGVASLFAAISETIILHFFTNNWLTLIGCSMIGGLIYGLSLLALKFFTDEELELLRGILQRKQIISQNE